MIESIKLEDFKGMFWQDIAALVVTRLNEVIDEVNKPKIHVSPKFTVIASGPDGQTTSEICTDHGCEYVDVSFDDGKTYKRFYPYQI